MEISNSVVSTLYRLDLSTGVATAIGPTGAPTLDGAGFANGTLYAYSGDSENRNTRIFSIDLTTGVATAGPTYRAANITGSDETIPEPSSCMLVLIGVVAFWFTLAANRRRSAFHLADAA
ncbi:MAG: hypothetical protein C5B50_24005 [Verrucomicrobia bacterium]|nr:MAG: hypothetical protein C5B50_24005 [Verrucomicrobiota bacterium]